MNVSSAIVFARLSEDGDLIRTLNAIEGCNVALHEGQKLVVSIEAENIAAETAIMKKIEDTPGVMSVKLVYSYSENELEQEIKTVEEAADFPKWLNDDTDARNIPYSGKLDM